MHLPARPAVVLMTAAVLAAAACTCGAFNNFRLQCQPGRYLSSGGCQACPSGYYCSGGQIGMMVCVPGQYSTGGASICTPCPIGSYQPSLGASLCTACPAGTYQPDVGAVSCYTRQISALNGSSSPHTAHVQLLVYGRNSGVLDFSGAVRVAATACATTRWVSNSLVRCRISRGSFTNLHVEASVLLSRVNKSDALTFSAPLASSVRGSAASSGSAHLALFGSSLGHSGFDSGAVRLLTTSCPMARWVSDSCISLRISGGSAHSAPVVIVSFGKQIAFSRGLVNYGLPMVYNLTDRALYDISVTGVNFGTFLAVQQRSQECVTNQTVPKQTNGTTICTSSQLKAGETGTITEASVVVIFSNSTRLDDVVLSLVSPQGNAYTLMRNKCFGNLPCPPNTVQFTFQILPDDPALTEAPVSMCSSSHMIVPDDAASLRLEMLSNDAMGDWMLNITTGTESQRIAYANILFKTATLDFRMGRSAVTSLSWISDSSAIMSSPGYQATNPKSSSGWGRNISFTAISSGLQMNQTATYSYPDPVVSSSSPSLRYASSGFTKIYLWGKYFSNAKPTALHARMGFTVCAKSVWSSHTTVTCMQSRSQGGLRDFALSIDRSAVAPFRSVLYYTPAAIVSYMSAATATTTATSSVLLIGSSFGMHDLTPRVRLSSNVLSSTGATKWFCDTMFSTKTPHSLSNSSGVLMSLNGFVHDFAAVMLPIVPPPVITAIGISNIPTTGAAVVRMMGSSLGLYAASSKVSIGRSSCVLSLWSSDSSIICKTAAGLSTNSLSIAATSLGLAESSKSSLLFYAHPSVNASADVMLENDKECFFNTSSCVPGRLIQLVHSSSAFGTCHYPQRQLRLVQGNDRRLCSNTSWISDSSIHCLYTFSVSPVFKILSVELVLQAEVTSFAVYIKNRFFKAAPPPLSNETVNFRFYSDLTYPRDEDQNFQEFGTTSGFVWPNSSLLASVQHSQVMTFSLLFFLSASQSFLDASFAPVETKVSGSVTIWNVTDVTSSILCDEVPSKNISFSLPPKFFWSKTAVSLALCARNSFSGQFFHLRVELNVRNVNGDLSLSLISPSFAVFSSEGISVNFVRQPSSSVNASMVYNNILAFRITYGTNLDNICEEVGTSFSKYSVQLVCAGQLSYFRSSLQLSGGFVDSSQCLQNVTAISFITPATNCYFNVSVLVGSVVQIFSQAFDIVPGIARAAALVGAGPFCASAGAIVWSLSSESHGLCLVAQLRDGEANNITYTEDATVVARNVNDSESSYPVARSVQNRSSESGLVYWCNAYSSATQKTGVVFGARVNGNITYWTTSVINVSSHGPAANLKPAAVALANNQSLLPGMSPQKVSFSLQDAGGNTVTSSSTTAVRVRIVPRSNTSTGRSVSSLSTSKNTGARRLLQRSAASCAGDTGLEFTFVQNASSSEIVAGPEFLCRVGVNDIFFDVGSVVAGSFVSTATSVFQMSVTVIPGDFETFVLVFADSSLVVKSFTLIDSLEIIFLDSGLNEVSGNATLSLACTNASAFVYPSPSFTVVSNATVKAFAPPFFVYVLEWTPSETPFKVGLTAANSSVFQYGNKIVTFFLHPTCTPGYHHIYFSLSGHFANLKWNKENANVSDVGSITIGCVKCANATVSNHNDAQSCKSVLRFDCTF